MFQLVIQFKTVISEIPWAQYISLNRIASQMLECKIEYPRFINALVSYLNVKTNPEHYNLIELRSVHYEIEFEN